MHYLKATITKALRLSPAQPLRVPHSVNTHRVAPVEPPTAFTSTPVNIMLTHAARITPYSLSFSYLCERLLCRRVECEGRREKMRSGELDGAGEEELSGAVGDKEIVGACEAVLWLVQMVVGAELGEQDDLGDADLGEQEEDDLGDAELGKQEEQDNLVDVLALVHVVVGWRFFL
jgi:hypothetical protein